MTEPQIDVSIVIPVYNEEGILSASVADLTEKLANQPGWKHRYEIILSENGSTDGTVAMAEELMKRHPNLRLIRAGEPNYGLAMRKGILEARGNYVMCDEIDLCDVDFYVRAIAKLDEGYDMVIGSKRLDPDSDKRPAYRKLATVVLNFMLRVFVGFKGTDTHGLKAFRRDRLLEVVGRCVVDKDLFASEFVIRAERMKYRVTEIPVTIVEKRPPSINLFKRVPNVLKNMVRLAWVIRVAHR
jgi:glycosyltransferase involved in cell wall biosynthesis